MDKFHHICVLSAYQPGALTNAYRALTNTYRNTYQHLPNEYRALFRHLPTLTERTIGHFSGTCHGDIAHCFAHSCHTSVTLCTLSCTLRPYLSHTSITPRHTLHTVLHLLTILIYSFRAYLHVISVQKAYIYTC